MDEQLASLKDWVPVVIIMGGFAGIMRLMLAPIRVELQEGASKNDSPSGKTGVRGSVASWRQ